MNPYHISQDPIWHRYMDGLIILFIGIAAGLVMAQALMTEETVITTETIRRTSPAPLIDPKIESGASIEVPSGAKVEEG
jgi:hypothetical protein